MNTMTKVQDQAVLINLNKQEKLEISQVFLSFLEGAATATGKATFYNTQAEQKNAIKAIHENLFSLDRSVYSLALMLPGFNDYSKQLGVVQLLSSARKETGLLNETQESQVILKLFNQLSVPRKLKLFIWLRSEKVNNARTRKLILRSLLGEQKLEWWSIKYKSKLKAALQHAWGKRTTSILKSILSKEASERSTKEKNILQNSILRYVSANTKATTVFECIAFVLGVKKEFTLPLFKEYNAAKQDLSKLTTETRLPFEVLEGIRSTYHKEFESAKVLELTKSTLTKGQQLSMQAKAEKANVNIAFNPLNYDPVKLYIYAYQQGWSNEIAQALEMKAQKGANNLSVKFDRIGLLLDNSQSMVGNETQQLRPMAIALSIRDVLRKASKECVIANNVDGILTDKLVVPTGDTALAMGLVELFEANVEQIFILSDGYENTPAGRVNEVMHLVRKMNIQTPVFQISPVMAAESKGIRKLSEHITAFAVNGGNGLNLGLLKAMFEVDFEKGLEVLLNTALPLLEG